jgi:hypothetical protein
LSNAFAPMEVEGHVGRVRIDGGEGDVGRVRIEPGRPQRVDNQWILPPPGGKPGERGALAPW